MMNYLLPIAFLIGLFSGYIMKDKWFTNECKYECPECICPECPPQTIYFIHNEKIKNKNGKLDLNNYLQVIDSLKLNQPKIRK